MSVARLEKTVSPTLIPVAELMSQARSLYEDSWESTLDYVRSSKYHMGVISLLMAELDRDGEFRTHVAIGTEGVADGDDELCLLNGHHRVIATYLHDKVSTIKVAAYDETATHDDSRLMETEITLSSSDTCFTTEEEWEELSDEMMFISAPISEAVWLASAGGSSKLDAAGNRIINVYWDFTGEEIENMSEAGLLTVNTFMENLIRSIGFTEFATKTYVLDLDE